MKKKIFIFSSILVLLFFLAGLVIWKTRPTQVNLNPLLSIEKEKIKKIVVDHPNYSVTFELKNAWMMTSPVEDVVEDAAVSRIADVLHDFSVGTVISENKKRFDQFDIQDGKAIRIRVFQDNDPKPLLDGYMGKMSSNYNSSFFRFQGEDRVLIGENLSNYIILGSTDDYRSKKIFSAKVAEANKIDIQSGSTHVQLSRSSVTWTNNANGKMIEPTWIQGLAPKLDGFRISSFVSDTTNLKTGFEKPSLVISVDSSSATAKVTIGSVLPKVAGKDSGQSYGQIEGRNGIFIVNETSVKDIQTILKTLPK